MATAGEGNREHFRKWATVIALVSAVAGVAAVLVSVYALQWPAQPPQFEPTVGMTSRAIAGYALDFDSQGNHLGEELTIQGVIDFENVGLQPTQIVDVQWEPYRAGDFDHSTGIFLVSSDPDPVLTAVRVGLPAVRATPVIGIRDINIGGRARKTIHFWFRGQTKIKSGTDVPRLKILLKFQHSDQVYEVPTDIRNIGVSI